MILKRRKKVPVGGGAGLEANALNLAKDGDDVRLFVLADGVIYEVSMLKRMSIASSSSGSNDHGLLSGLSDDDHSQYHNDTRGDARYPTKAALTTKGDIYVATAASTVTRKAAGTTNHPLIADSGQSDGLRYGGNITLSGALAHTGSTAGFFNVSAASRPSALTQTYSTADRTHASRAAASFTDNIGGTPGTTLAAIPDPADTPITADALRDDIVTNVLPVIRNILSSLATQHNNSKTDSDDTAQFVNSIADDLQTLGLEQ